MFRSIAMGACACLLLVAGAAHAEDAAKASAFTPAQRAELNKLIHDYIVQNPDVLSEGIQALEAKEKRAQEAKAKQAVAAHAKELVGSPEGTVIGNPKGDVTLVEFFDYNCGYCKALFPSLMDTIKADGKVRVVLKEFPILTDSSKTASQAALASVKQGKYADFHVALMSHKGSLNEETILKIAKDTGLDVARLQTDMKAAEVQKVIDKNLDLAHDLDISGTPTIVVGKSLVPGAIEKDELKSLITKARTKS